MAGDVASLQARLAHWRERAETQADPVRTRLIEALASRAARCDGELRALLEQRLATLITAAEADTPRGTGSAADTPRAGAQALHALRQRLDAVAAPQVAHAAGGRVQAPAPAAFPALPALDDFRDTWTKVRTDSQLRQALEQVPEDAGPLNSGMLLHRAITLMRDVSPGYLRHFMAYVDALSGMEQVHGSGVVPAREQPSAASPRKPSRPRTRKRAD